jgi:hypothetical protein
MELFRIHAYEVVPQRLSATKTKPRGGAFKADAVFKASLEKYIEQAKLESQPPVSFQPRFEPDAEQATNPVRDHVLDYAFGPSATAKSAAVKMAERLGSSMDDRSASSLLILTSYRQGAKRRFIAWAFPKDEPYGFGVKGDHANLSIIENAFSRSSSYRKAALFSGLRQHDHYWNGHVIDRQSTPGFGAAADYWVTGFLTCKYLIDGKSGTQMLAKVIRETHQKAESQADQDLLTSAVISVRGSQRKNWSLKSFAEEFLKDTAKSSFLANCPKEAVTAKFPLDQDELASKVNLRVFRLEDDVIVMAPFDSMNKSVKLTGTKDRKLTCKGTVVEEKVRAQRAR